MGRRGNQYSHVQSTDYNWWGIQSPVKRGDYLYRASLVFSRDQLVNIASDGSSRQVQEINYPRKLKHFLLWQKLESLIALYLLPIQLSIVCLSCFQRLSVYCGLKICFTSCCLGNRRSYILSRTSKSSYLDLLDHLPYSSDYQIIFTLPFFWAGSGRSTLQYPRVSRSFWPFSLGSAWVWDVAIIGCSLGCPDLYGVYHPS